MPSEIPELTKLDLHILTILTDEVLWKQKLTDAINENGPDDTTSSVQTVSRHVDTLRKHGLLDTQIVNPDGIRRTIILAYTTTTKGDAALEEYQVCKNCGELVAATDHVHCPESPDSYFSAPL